LCKRSSGFSLSFPQYCPLPFQQLKISSLPFHDRILGCVDRRFDTSVLLSILVRRRDRPGPPIGRIYPSESDYFPMRNSKMCTPSRKRNRGSPVLGRFAVGVSFSPRCGFRGQPFLTKTHHDPLLGKCRNHHQKNQQTKPPQPRPPNTKNPPHNTPTQPKTPTYQTPPHPPPPPTTLVVTRGTYLVNMVVPASLSSSFVLGFFVAPSTGPKSFYQIPPSRPDGPGGFFFGFFIRDMLYSPPPKGIRPPRCPNDEHQSPYFTCTFPPVVPHS